jgi:hypothetical protein
LIVNDRQQHILRKFKPLIEKGKVYIIKNVKVTPAAQKYQPVDNDKVLNFLPTTNIKKIKDIQDIQKYSFMLVSIEMISNRVNINKYVSDKLLLMLSFYAFPLI